MGQMLAYSRQPRTWLTALLGVGAMEGFFSVAPRMGLTRMDNATPNGTYVFPPGWKASLLGFLTYYGGSVGLVSVFRALRPRLKGTDPARGVKYASGVYLFASLVVMPFVSWTNPYMRRGKMKKPGFFGLGLEGWRTAASNLIGHLIYGRVIGSRWLNKE
jgi:hypothetical protein